MESKKNLIDSNIFFSFLSLEFVQKKQNKKRMMCLISDTQLFVSLKKIFLKMMLNCDKCNGGKIFILNVILQNK